MMSAIGRDLLVVTLCLAGCLIGHAVMPDDPLFRDMAMGFSGALLALVQRDAAQGKGKTE